ncbi:hypothetical protein PVA45_06280 [Entomospira entomophila]|uniref:RND efflux pump membrane fusion protein barrel-sandwich domain-containing protein n=1 Tax=Entomospira entomophila TaxID=2719988 RepID=A0A968G9L1_9SPIO|nr:hypothetical protein [Entomospira entomophilus]NIZ41105.1 hypothetical protein [Entomospira entomophilus]WDI35313.1 hypothetical protein PVA45_06280 [Entomospira entomophilus]
MYRKIVFPSIMMLLIALWASAQQGGGGNRRNASDDGAQGIIVFVEPIQRHDLYHKRMFGGRLEPTQTFPQTSLVTGVIQSVNVSIGQYVSKGQLLYTVQQIVIAQNYKPTPIYAQNSGIVVDISHHIGDRITTNESVVTLADFHHLKIHILVGEQDFFNIKKGDSVYLPTHIEQAEKAIAVATTIKERTDDSLLQEQQEAIIQANKTIIEKSVGYISALPLIPDYKTGLFTVEVTFNRANHLFFGKFERVELRTQRTYSLAVDQSHLIYRYGRNHLLMLDTENVLYLREVEVGETFGEYVTILAGIEDGEHIVVRANGRYQVGDTVTPRLETKDPT